MFPEKRSFSDRYRFRAFPFVLGTSHIHCIKFQIPFYDFFYDLVNWMSMTKRRSPSWGLPKRLLSLFYQHCSQYLCRLLRHETHEVSDCISELTLASLLRGVWYARAAIQGYL